MLHLLKRKDKWNRALADKSEHKKSGPLSRTAFFSNHGKGRRKAAV
jgi:hypothetical protein